MSYLDKLRDLDIFKRLENSNERDSIENSKIAIRNSDEIFFAHHSTIRYTKVSDFTNYKILDINVLDFIVSGIKLNSSGTLLAIYNESNIVISSLPPKINPNASLIKVKSFKVGSDIFSSNKILDLLWNGISRFDSTLVVLSSDGIIRSFDPYTSTNIPEAAYDTSLSSSFQVGFSSNSVENPIAISFGSETTLSGALTLYILNKEGDIYSIYPFLPKTLAVSKDAVEELLNETVLLTNTSIDENGVKDSAEGSQSAIYQLRFIADLWKQIPSSPVEIRNTRKLHVLETHSPDSFFIQGPFAIQPYPEDLYDDAATGLITVPLESTDLLVISFEKSGFITLLQDINLTMKWIFDEYDEYLIVDDDKYAALTLLEHKPSKAKSPTHIAALGGATFLLENSSQLYEVDLSSWSEVLDSSLKEGIADNFIKLLSQPLVTNFNNIFGLSNSENYEGSGVLVDSFGRSYKVFISDHKKKIVGTKVDEVEEDEDTRTKSKSHPHFSPSNPEITKLLRTTSSFKIKSPSSYSSQISADENSLRNVNEISEQVIKQLINYHRLGLGLGHSLFNQKAELERQLDQSSEIFQKQKSLESQRSNTENSIKKAVERQENINSRLERLTSKLQQAPETPLSLKEKHWFKEIQNLAYFFNSTVKRNQTLNQQLAYIKSEIRSRSNSKFSKNIETSDLQDWENLNAVLNEGKKLLNQTSSSLSENLSGLGQQLNNVHI